MGLTVFLSEVQRVDIHSSSLTHNLAPMAKAAGLYAPLWRPEECGIISAEQLADAIRPGYIELRDNRDKYAKLDAKDGWGDYDGLVSFTESLLCKCENNPGADVTVSV